MSPTRFNTPLHLFACATAAATLLLVGVGGLVTSHGVGMAVPDWPNTYGYNMFFFPISQWVGGIFYEHTHRLMASTVGLFTAVLALWLQGHHAQSFLRWIGLTFLALGIAIGVSSAHRQADALVLGGVGLVALSVHRIWPRCEPSSNWLRRLGWIAFGLVVLQGILGGLRVVLFKDQIGILHAALAQIFLAVVCSIALFTSKLWIRTHSTTAPHVAMPHLPPVAVFRGFTVLLVAITSTIFLQLLLGAAMRHQHAGLSIPDFPLAYGRIWPKTDDLAVLQYNQQRIEVVAANPITAGQIYLQMAHRITAVGILFGAAWLYRQARRQLGAGHWLSRGALLWLGAVVAQALLGAWTIWSNKAADVATAHVMLGALLLSLGTLLSIAWVGQACGILRLPQPVAQPAANPGEFASPLTARETA